MRIISTITVILLCISLNACVEVDRKLLVNTDGSGTLTERIALKGPFAEMMQQMQSGGSTIIEQGKVDAHAKSLGEGVKVASVRPLPEDQGIGAIAVFSFDNLNNLKINPDLISEQNEDKTTPSKPAKPPKPITFTFKAGPLAELTINMGDNAVPVPGTKRRQQQDQNKQTPSKEAGKFATKMLQEMLGGMRIRMSVEVAGHIIDSTASYRDGNLITLMELDFDKILANPQGSKALQAQPGDDPEAMKEAIRNIAGVKLETKQEITIVFSAQTTVQVSPPSQTLLTAN